MLPAAILASSRDEQSTRQTPIFEHSSSSDLNPLTCKIREASQIFDVQNKQLRGHPGLTRAELEAELDSRTGFPAFTIVCAGNRHEDSNRAYHVPPKFPRSIDYDGHTRYAGAIMGARRPLPPHRGHLSPLNRHWINAYQPGWPSAQQGIHSGANNHRASVICYSCGRSGHIRRQCITKTAGKVQGSVNS